MHYNACIDSNFWHFFFFKSTNLFKYLTIPSIIYSPSFPHTHHQIEHLCSHMTYLCEAMAMRIKLGALPKVVNTVPEAVPVWPPIRYISDTGQYRCTVSGLPLFYIFNIYIYIYIHTHIHTYIHKISIYHKTIPQKFMFIIKHYFN